MTSLKQRERKKLMGYIYWVTSTNKLFSNWIEDFTIICLKYLYSGLQDKFVDFRNNSGVNVKKNGIALLHLPSNGLILPKYLYGNLMFVPADNPNAIITWKIRVNVPFMFEIGIQSEYQGLKKQYCKTINWEGQSEMLVSVDLDINKNNLDIGEHGIWCKRIYIPDLHLDHNSYHLVMSVCCQQRTLRRRITSKKHSHAPTNTFSVAIDEFQYKKLHFVHYPQLDRIVWWPEHITLDIDGHEITGNDTRIPSPFDNSHGYNVIVPGLNPYLIAIWTLAVRTQQVWIGIEQEYNAQGIANNYGWFGDVNSNNYKHQMYEHDTIRMMYNVPNQQLIFWRNNHKIHQINNVNGYNRYHLIISIPRHKLNSVDLINSTFQHWDNPHFAPSFDE